VSRIVVIGAGIGGLAAAGRLAAAGHDVTIVERAETVGGKLGRHERRTDAGVFRFDTGPSLLTLPQVFDDLFRATGSALEDELELVALEPLVRHVFADGSVLDSTSDPAEFAGRIAVAVGHQSAADWQRLWRRAERVWTASWRHVIRSRMDSPWSLARLVWRVGDLAAIAPGRTLRGLGRSYLSDPRLRLMLDRYATYAGSDPRRAPAALVAIPYAELAFGGWYIAGGLASLAEALRRQCDAHGVRIRLGLAATRIDTAAGRVTGVRLADGGRLPADIVVANADAATVHNDLVPSRRHRVKAGDRSLSGFVLLLGVRGRTPDLAHHTVFFPPDYDAEFDAVFGRPPRPVDDPTLFVSVADDPRVRPEGNESWYILVNAPPHGRSEATVDWRAPGRADDYADRVLETLATRGLEVRPRVMFREVLTPADLAEATGTPDGAIYGTARHGLRGLARPSNRGPVPGLFLVGGSTHPGGGLPMVALSAEIVAASIGPA
jgi:phytoene desaturase